MKYHISLKIIHWLTALIVVAMLVCGFVMTDLDPKIYPIKWSLYGWHKDFGVLIMLLTLFRLLLRNITKIPELPTEFSKLIKFGAHMMHYLFYVVLMAEPIFGYLMSSYGGHEVFFFGAELPSLVSPNKELAASLAELHEITAILLIVMICLHISVALKHRYIDKQDIIYRMT